MFSGETPLTMVQRHVREGEAHIHRQREIVQTLDASQSAQTETARKLLDQFVSLQGEHQAHLALIEEEQRLGRRDADGNLVGAGPDDASAD